MNTEALEVPPKPKGQQRTLASLWGNTGSKKKTLRKNKRKKRRMTKQWSGTSNSISTKQVKPDNSKTSAAKSTPKEGNIANGTLVKKVCITTITCHYVLI